MQYYIRLKGKPFGPFDENQLADMKSKGKISPSSEISADRVNWQAASTLDFLFPAVTSAQPQQAQLSASTYQAQPAMDFGTQFSPQEQKIWYYSFDGNSGYGPETQSTVVQMIQSRQLNGQSYVWKEGQTAVFAQSVDVFAPYFSGTRTADTNRASSANSTAVFDFNDSWQPLERSVGWIMFLKVLSLVGWILFGLVFILGVVFMMSRAVAGDSATVLLVTIIVILLEGGYYYLMFRPFLALWKYHTVLQRATVSRQDTELAEANQYLFQYWKDLGIFMIVTLSIVVLSVIIVVIAAGAGAGWAERFYGL
jgi:hypothetical protein